MNNDLISREALKMNEPHYDEEGYRIFYESEIDNAPTVPLPDFKEGYKQAIRDGKTNFSRPQGKWKYVTMSTLGLQIARCTNCNEKAYGMTDFCPNCGADMRGENTDS